MLAHASVAAAARAAAEAPERARIELVGPFLESAAGVLKSECGETVGKGTPHRVLSGQTTTDVSAVVAITGSVAGLVVYSMSETVARHIAVNMIGEPVEELDPLAQSAIGELANIITGHAGIRLQRSGFPSDMSPPLLLLGHGQTIAEHDLPRLVVPLILSCGEFKVDVAIGETPQARAA